MTVDFAVVDVDVCLTREQTPGEDDFVFSPSAFDSLLSLAIVGVWDDVVAAKVAGVVLIGIGIE